MKPAEFTIALLGYYCTNIFYGRVVTIENVTISYHVVENTNLEFNISGLPCWSEYIQDLYSPSIYIGFIYREVEVNERLLIYLYNNTPSKAIVNSASNITYRPLIEADDTGR
jgi:TATA-box binding protein (TBP) (component of TFIID and TFIIIB)